MNQQLTKKNTAFKKNTGGLIISISAAVLCLGLAGLIITFLFLWGSDIIALFFLFFLLGWAAMFISSAVMNLRQTSVTVNQYDEILLGDKKEAIKITDVKIRLEKESFNGARIVILILFGLLLGILYFISLGMYSLTITYNNKDYILRSLKKDSFKRLEPYINQQNRNF